MPTLTKNYNRKGHDGGYKIKVRYSRDAGEWSLDDWQVLDDDGKPAADLTPTEAADASDWAWDALDQLGDPQDNTKKKGSQRDE